MFIRSSNVIAVTGKDGEPTMRIILDPTPMDVQAVVLDNGIWVVSDEPCRLNPSVLAEVSR